MKKVYRKSSDTDTVIRVYSVPLEMMTTLLIPSCGTMNSSGDLGRKVSDLSHSTIIVDCDVVVVGSNVLKGVFLSFTINEGVSLPCNRICICSIIEVKDFPFYFSLIHPMVRRDNNFLRYQ